MDLFLPNVIFPWNELYSKIDTCVCQNISEGILSCLFTF